MSTIRPHISFTGSAAAIYLSRMSTIRPHIGDWTHWAKVGPPCPDCRVGCRVAGQGGPLVVGVHSIRLRNCCRRKVRGRQRPIPSLPATCDLGRWLGREGGAPRPDVGPVLDGDPIASTYVIRLKLAVPERYVEELRFQGCP